MLMHVVTAIAFWRHYAFCRHVDTCAYMLCSLLLICQHRKYFFLINCFVITWFFLRLHVTQIALQLPFWSFYFSPTILDRLPKVFIGTFYHPSPRTYVTKIEIISLDKLEKASVKIVV